MSIKFKIREIGRPGDPDSPKKFYAKHVHSGEISLDELAESISNSSSVNESDVYAVLQSLVQEIPKHIAEGKIVRLGNLGSFRLITKSTGSNTAEKVSSKNIIQPRIYFEAGKRIKTLLKKLKFERQR